MAGWWNTRTADDRRTIIVVAALTVVVLIVGFSLTSARSGAASATTTGTSPSSTSTTSAAASSDPRSVYPQWTRELIAQGFFDAPTAAALVSNPGLDQTYLDGLRNSVCNANANGVSDAAIVRSWVERYGASLDGATDMVSSAHRYFCPL